MERSGLWQSLFRAFGKIVMAFFNSAVGVLQTIVIASEPDLASGAASTSWKVTEMNNPGAKSQGMKQLMAGGGVA
jgi:hypothetical protein